MNHQVHLTLIQAKAEQEEPAQVQEKQAMSN